jgi:hypothetical protein
MPLPKYKRNTGKQWTEKDVKSLKKLAKKNTPTRVIGLELGRTEGAIYQKAHEESVNLHPVNQSPYNRKK